MHLSDIGARLSGHTGVVDLMEDMAGALADGNVLAMLGGGNPARIPEVESTWRAQLEAILAAPGRLELLLGAYDSPQGSPTFRTALAALLQRTYGWDIGPDHIAVTNGSQQAFFLLLNLVSGAGGGTVGATVGDTVGGSARRGRVLFPLVPEYIGYADQGLDPGAFIACQPVIERADDHSFKYRVDMDAVEETIRLAADGPEPVAAICVSRPTNPSGNVLTDAEIRALDSIADRYGIPLFVDNAYGLPFPSIIFPERIDGDARPVWSENIVLGMSLSKIGLPGLRTGVVVARPEIVRALRNANAVLALANTTLGQALAEPLCADGRILTLADEVIAPWYRRRSLLGVELLTARMSAAVDWAVHRIEGSIFMWLWVPQMPISSRELYARLKARGVIVVPGEYFFFGGTEAWPHARECLRINYGRETAELERGLQIIAEEIARL